MFIHIHWLRTHISVSVLRFFVNSDVTPCLRSLRLALCWVSCGFTEIERQTRRFKIDEVLFPLRSKLKCSTHTFFTSRSHSQEHYLFVCAPNVGQIATNWFILAFPLCVCQKINTKQIGTNNFRFYVVAFIWWAITFINNIYSMMYFMLEHENTVLFQFNSFFCSMFILMYSSRFFSGYGISNTKRRRRRQKNEIKLIVYGLCHMICINCRCSKSKWKWLRNKCLYFHSWTLTAAHRHSIDLDWWLQMAMTANRKVLCWMISPNYSCKPSNGRHKHNQIKTKQHTTNLSFGPFRCRCCCCCLSWVIMFSLLTVNILSRATNIY